jgi:hypothetical protein
MYDGGEDDEKERQPRTKGTTKKPKPVPVQGGEDMA